MYCTHIYIEQIFQKVELSNYCWNFLFLCCLKGRDFFFIDMSFLRKFLNFWSWVRSLFERCATMNEALKNPLFDYYLHIYKSSEQMDKFNLFLITSQKDVNWIFWLKTLRNSFIINHGCFIFIISTLVRLSKSSGSLKKFCAPL